ncbi:MAG TPA: 6-carboxytetrahydropterin synthase [Anaerolineales bacterium]|nr:6-carboxytetrahydropterin synthase [Anaerolineales bacterium]
MYRLSLTRSFTARHFLVGGDWGEENQLHAHPYRLEVVLEGPELDSHGYLVDLVAVERLLDDQIGRVQDRTLNELPAFAGLNPSLEHFARILATALADGLPRSLSAVEVRVWESESAWASYRLDLR